MNNQDNSNDGLVDDGLNRSSLLDNDSEDRMNVGGGSGGGGVGTMMASSTTTMNENDNGSWEHHHDDPQHNVERRALSSSLSLTTPLLLRSDHSDDNEDDDVEQQQQQQQQNGTSRRRSSRRPSSSASASGGTRLLDRAGTFHQSRGRWGIERISSSSSRSRRRRRSSLYTVAGGIDDDEDVSEDFRPHRRQQQHHHHDNNTGSSSSSSQPVGVPSNTNDHDPIRNPSSRAQVRNSSRSRFCFCGSCSSCSSCGCCRKAVQCVRYCCPWCWWCVCRCGPIRQFFRIQWGKDWFFYLAYQKTCVLFMLLFTSYTVIVCFFGFVYLGLSIIGSKSEINPDGSTKTIAFCDMDINDHMEAMYFSLSTMTTIGYGVSDYYFGGCYSPLLIVLWQVCTAIVFDAVAVGLIFHRISRGAKRSRTILFSDMAVVRRVGGIPYLMFRLGERRQYHLIEATVRCYCVRHTRLPVPVVENSMTNTTNHEGPTRRYNSKNQRNGRPDGTSSSDDLSLTTPMRIETTHFVSRQMRLVHPNDQYGSHVWMGLPQIVVHRLDDSSPLVPHQPYWFDSQGRSCPNPWCRSPTTTMGRSSKTTSDDCSIHSASPTTKQYLDPLATTTTTSASNNPNLSTDVGRTPSIKPPPSSLSTHVDTYHYENNCQQGIPGRSIYDDLDSIYAFLDDRDAEIVVLVEGTDEVTGAAIQARHSYKVNDIALNHTFADCVFPYNRRQRRGRSADNDPVVSIDFSKFHDVTPAPLDCATCAYIPT